ncbi:MAG: hypothetical protein H7061_07200 [Bdellovibrionaceae bacterium]|nr:hypothetical protein [Bdellovibrio sp.]
MIAKLKTHINAKNKPLIIAFLLFVVAFIAINFGAEKGPLSKDKIYADTMIPKGLVLLPIELANADTVSGLIDQFGVIDLYAGQGSAGGSKKIAAKVKILRAPLNPQQYAVLVPENLSKEIMHSVGPFYAVVQNRQVQYEEKVNVPVKAVSIEYYKGGM